MKTENEIEEQIEKLEEEGENYCSGMSYYEGVKTVLEWVIEISNESPVEE